MSAPWAAVDTVTSSTASMRGLTRVNMPVPRLGVIVLDVHAVQGDVDRALREAVHRGVADAARGGRDAGHVGHEVERPAALDRKARNLLGAERDATDVACVWIISVAPDTTTVSSRAPSASTALTFATWATFAITSFRTAVLKPIKVTVMV